MAEYRLYFIDTDGERLGAFDFASTDDRCAEAAAKQFGCERGADLWCGGRLVGGWRREQSPDPDRRAAAVEAAPAAPAS